jgi:hypothetical protein
MVLPEPAQIPARIATPRPQRFALAMRAGEALRAGLKICERCRLKELIRTTRAPAQKRKVLGGAKVSF